MEIMSQIIDILTSGLVDFGQKLGAGIQAIVQALFVDINATTGAQSLTVFGILIVVFAGIGLAVGITRRMFSWLITLGGRK